MLNLNAAVRLASPMALAVALAIAPLALSACADDRPPPTRDDVLRACGDFNVEGCLAFQRCLGWDETELWNCINGENSECVSDLQPETCWENQRDALERCTADLSDDSCSEVCNNGFCSTRCLYFCPPS